MASRDALRAFQSRLASRLQEARTSGAGAAWLAVEISGSSYIFPWTNVQAVPHSREWFLGVANLRGGVSGVVDLGAFVMDKPSVPRTELAQSQCRLVAFNDALSINCAVLVDKLLGLKSLESFVVSDPASENSPVYFGHRYTDPQGASWQEISLQSLSQHPQFLSISA